MYDLVSGLIDHSWATNSGEQSYVYYICGTLIVVMTVMFIDIAYNALRQWWRH